MRSLDVISKDIFDKIHNLLEMENVEITQSTPLIGDESLLDSMKLVELCLLLEEMAEVDGFEFDWTSDAAMSRSRSMFRTAGALAAAYVSQMENLK